MDGMAIVVKKPKEARYSSSSEEEMGDEGEGEGDEFAMGFEAFRAALKTGDSAKGRKAFRLMKAACEDDYEDEEG